MMSTEKTLKGRLQKKKSKSLRSPKAPKNLHGRQWWVVRCVMIWRCRVCARKFRGIRNSGDTAGTPHKPEKLLPLPPSPEGFDLPFAHRPGPMLEVLSDWRTPKLATLRHLCAPWFSIFNSSEQLLSIDICYRNVNRSTTSHQILQCHHRACFRWSFPPTDTRRAAPYQTIRNLRNLRRLR